MSWSERKELMQGSSYNLKKIFSFTMFMIILLASFTIVFVVMPFNAKADIPTAPTIGEITYGGWDKDGDSDDDNCYAQYREYTIAVTYTDMNGWNSLQTVSLCLGDYTFMPGTTRVTFTYAVAERTFGVVTDGLEKWDLESDYWTPGDVKEDFPNLPYDITITWKFKPQWDADEDIDLDIQAKADDGGFPEATQVEAPDFDVVTTLLTNKLESTFEEVPDDHVDVGSEIQMDFEIRYADEPESSIPQSEIYPPGGHEGEFVLVTLFKVAENGEPCEDPIGDPFLAESITEGGGTFEEPFVPPGAEVAEHTFRLQVTMTDEDYGDAGVGWLANLDEIVITDRILITSLTDETSGDGVVNITDEVTLQVIANYEYGGNPDAASITIGGQVFTAVDGQTFTATVQENSYASITYDTFSGISGDDYGITVGNMDGNSETVTWEQILINWSADSYSIDAGSGAVATINLTGAFEFGGGNSLDSYRFNIRETYCDTEITDITNKGQGDLTVQRPVRRPGVYNYTITSCQNDVYGITANTTNETISINVMQNIDLDSTTNGGINYIVWCGPNTTAGDLNASLGGLNPGDKIMKYNTTTGNFLNEAFVSATELENFTINTWDVIRIALLDPGSTTIDLSLSGETIYPYHNKTFDYTGDNGGLNYFSWSDSDTTAVSSLASTLTLPTGYCIYKFNTTTGNWDTHITNITPGWDVNPNDVLCCYVDQEKKDIDLYST